MERACELTTSLRSHIESAPWGPNNQLKDVVNSYDQAKFWQEAYFNWPTWVDWAKSFTRHVNQLCAILEAPTFRARYSIESQGQFTQKLRAARDSFGSTWRTLSNHYDKGAIHESRGQGAYIHSVFYMCIYQEVQHPLNAISEMCVMIEQRLSELTSTKHQTQGAGMANKNVPKILFLSSNPTDTKRIQLDTEYSRVKARLENSIHRDRFDLRHSPDIRINDVPRELRRYSPNVLHFSGHGDDGGFLVMKRSDDSTGSMTPEGMANLIKIKSDSIKAVVLNACHSEPLAKALVSFVPCVVGTSESIDDSAATLFSEIFYEALLDGDDILTAFETAKAAVQAEFDECEADFFRLYSGDGVDPSRVLLVTSDPQ